MRSVSNYTDGYFLFGCRYTRFHLRTKIVALFTGVFVALIPCTVNAQSNFITLQFENVAGNKPLNSDSSYTNAFGETFTVQNFKYYISHIVLEAGNNNETNSFQNEYFLVDNADTASKKITLNTTLQQVSSIHFLLGIDSLMNVSGVQSGNLDPAKGMFWTWNTGYVMAKLDGNSPVAKTPGHAFSYHVGGYKQNEQTARLVSLILPQAMHIDNISKITINANIDKWFNSVHKIKISETPFCHEPGTLAMLLADNYANMFSIAEQ